MSPLLSLSLSLSDSLSFPVYLRLSFSPCSLPKIASGHFLFATSRSTSTLLRLLAANDLSPITAAILFDGCTTCSLETFVNASLSLRFLLPSSCTSNCATCSHRNVSASFSLVSRLRLKPRASDARASSRASRSLSRSRSGNEEIKPRHAALPRNSIHRKRCARSPVTRWFASSVTSTGRSIGPRRAKMRVARGNLDDRRTGDVPDEPRTNRRTYVSRRFRFNRLVIASWWPNGYGASAFEIDFDLLRIPTASSYYLIRIYTGKYFVQIYVSYNYVCSWVLIIGPQRRTLTVNTVKYESSSEIVVYISYCVFGSPHYIVSLLYYHGYYYHRQYLYEYKYIHHRSTFEFSF